MVNDKDQKNFAGELSIGGLNRLIDVDAEALLATAQELSREGFRLDAIVPQEEGGALRSLYLLQDDNGQRAAIACAIPQERPSAPSLGNIWPEADWPERRARDLFGIVPVGHPRPARLLRHTHWPAGYYPMVHHQQPERWPAERVTELSFAGVRGEGVHEIPVGPIHAGIIEPGHFRFYADGERIVSLELKLFYAHRGLERLMEGCSPDAGLALAELVSGDTAIGHSWAYAAAVESALGLTVSPEALALRGLLLELERICCHIGDLGAILNDIAYGWLFTQCQGLREDLLQAYEAAFGHRFLRGVLAIGGVRKAPADLGPLLAIIEQTVGQIQELAQSSLSRAAVIERLRTTGILSKKEAHQHRALGLAARASGLPVDCRRWQPKPYGPSFEPQLAEAGDVEARFAVRLAELAASLELARSFVARAAQAATPAATASGASGSGAGIGCAEGWRGECLHYVDIAAGKIVRWAPRDPSALNWPLLPLAVAGDLVPDFPVINKSFNLSYAGNDL